MLKKEVTILLATYNGAMYLEEQLESIQKQEYTNWKLIVGDDGSTDDTINILRAFQKKVLQQVEIIRNEPPTGSAKNNFMQLIEKADTPYIMFCDQDDIWKPNKIKDTLKYMKRVENNEDIPVLIHTDLSVLGEQGILAESFFKYQNLPSTMKLSSVMIQNSVTGCTMMINRALQRKMQKLTDYQPILMHDYWAALVAVVFGRVGVVEKSTMLYRQHGNNSVGAKASHNPVYLLKRLFEGRKKYKEQMQESRNQVAYFLKVYENEKHESKEAWKLLEQYAALGERNKCYRMWFYKKNKVYKSGKIRVLMQYIWG